MSEFDAAKARQAAEEYSAQKWVIGQQAVCKDGFNAGARWRHSVDAATIEKLEGQVAALQKSLTEAAKIAEDGKMKLEGRIRKLREALEWVYGTFANSDWMSVMAAEQNFINLKRTIGTAKDALKQDDEAGR